MRIETPIGESASLLPPHVRSIDETGETILLLCIKIELYIFLSSPLGSGGACFCFDQPPRLAAEGLRDAGPLIPIVPLAHCCCSQKAAPGQPPLAPATEPCASPGQNPHGLSRGETAPASGQGSDSPGRGAETTASALPQSRHQSEDSHRGRNRILLVFWGVF